MIAPSCFPKKANLSLPTIGPYRLNGVAVLAPMAGITDLPFRQLCRRYGAALVTGEMITSKTELWHSEKSRLRLPSLAEPEPRAGQIVGNEPAAMADAARRCQDHGAQVIDINLGCPAKKVCRKAAGSALMRDESLVADIVTAVVAAVKTPVTLKMRTGWDLENRNAPAIAALAEDCGIQALAVHGRSRACRFAGSVEFDTVAAVVNTVSIPVFANGDITSPAHAKEVLARTGAAGVMIGRGALGKPWLFRQVNHYLNSGQLLPEPAPAARLAIARGHLEDLHEFYGTQRGPRIGRKHIGWYLETLASRPDLNTFNAIRDASEQLAFLDQLTESPLLVSKEAA
jgi:tRNA-dihydrouridine synthase B